MRVLLLFVFCVFSIQSVAQQQDRVIDVNVVYPEQSHNSRIITLSGTIEAKQHAELAALESGLVSQLLVEIGDEVTEGQVLLSLNDRLASLQVDSANASLQVATVNRAEADRLYKEVLALSKRQVVAQTLIAEREAMLANAEAELARVQANLALQQEILARHTLRAPFDGVIAVRNIDLGEWVTQQSWVLSLVDQRHLRLSVAIPQEYFRYLQRSQKIDVKILPDVNQAVPIEATLTRFVPVSSGNSRAFMAQIDLPLDTGLAAGMSARAEITVPNTKQSTIILPISAVKRHPDGGSSVFIVENGIAKRVITAYTDMQNGTVAISGQAFDKAYVISGVELLTDGSMVNATTVSSAAL